MNSRDVIVVASFEDLATDVAYSVVEVDKLLMRILWILLESLGAEEELLDRDCNRGFLSELSLDSLNGSFAEFKSAPREVCDNTRGHTGIGQENPAFFDKDAVHGDSEFS